MDCNILRRKMLSSRIKGICTAENGVAAIGESKTAFDPETGFYVISVLKIALRNNAIIKSRAQKFGGHKTVDGHSSRFELLWLFLHSSRLYDNMESSRLEID